MASRNTNKPLSKATRTDFRCSYEIAFCTWRCRQLLAEDLQEVISARLTDLEDDLDLSIVYRSITPSSVTLRVLAPPFLSPLTITSRIKAGLHRAIVEAQPDIKKRVPTLFTRAAYLRTVGQPAADGASVFLAKERGSHEAR
jgi:putative transposase